MRDKDYESMPLDGKRRYRRKHRAPLYWYEFDYNRKDGSIAKTQTVCGLCMTWASAGNLRAIKGKQTIEYLQKLLPLPDYFSDPKTAKDVVVFAENKSVPYFQLEKK